MPRLRDIVGSREFAFRQAINAATFMFPYDGGNAMTKSKDQKKQSKKEPSKTPKEKKEAKKLKKQERKV